MKSLLVLLDVEGPVSIEIPAQVDGSQLDDSFRHGFGPTHAGSLHPVLDQVLAGPFHRTAGNRPALCQVVVVTHPMAVAGKVISNAGHVLDCASDRLGLVQHWGSP